MSWTAAPDAPGGGAPWSGGGPGAEARALDDAVVAAQAALRDVVAAAGHLRSLGVAQHQGVLRALAVVQRLADAAALAVVDSLAGRDRAELLAVGVSSPVDAVVRATGASAAAARRQVALAASARPDRVPGDLGDAAGPALPLLGAALARAEVSTEAVALAVATVRALPARLRRLHLAEVDALLAEVLPGLSLADAAAFCDRLLDRLDPDRADRGFDPEDYEKRRLHVTRHGDGWVGVSGLLDPVTGAQLVAGLDHYSRPDPTVEAAVADVDGCGAEGAGAVGAAASGGAAARGGAPVVRLRDTRTRDQRRADALGLIARQGVTNSETRGGEPPRVVITATQAQVDGVPGAGRAECEQTGPVPAAVLRAVLSRAVIQAVVMSSEGADAAVLALGRTARLFTAAQKRAVHARDGGCALGCDAPLPWLEGHHVVDWAAGGLTDVGNGVLLCPHHHLLVTLGVWQVRMVAGAPQVRPPVEVDPLRRWLRSPRRVLRARADAAGEQLVLAAASG